MRELEIRPPRAMRIYVVAFSTVWCAAVASAGVRGVLAGSAAALVTVPMLGIGAGLGYRLSRLGVRAERDTLIVRNNWSARTLARSDIEGFRVGGMTGGGLPGSQVVQVLLRDETVFPLDVTTAALPLPRSRARLHERLQQLRAWHGS